jgi:CRISPR-associated protein Csc3
MLIQELFQRATANRGPVTQRIATVLAPAILREFAAIPALGGSGKPLAVQESGIQALLDTIPAYAPEELQAFSAKGFDQSLSTHLINGLFAGMYLAERLPEWKMLASAEQQVWTLGYTVHDYTKAYSRKVSAGQLDVARRLVSKLGERLEFDRFMESWQAYLDDIVFVAQNTQTVQGANLNLRDYTLRLDKRQREAMRMLSSVTDLLVHITSPSDVLFRDVRGRDLAYNLRQKVEMLFGAEFAPRLAYHKLLEVCGLLSNLINNAMIDVLGEQGYEPFLFFPEGVIYLAPRNTQARVEVEQVTEAAWKHITGLLTGGNQRPVEEEEEDSEEAENGEEGQGLRMQRSKDYMRVPRVLYELLSLDALLEMGRQVAMSIHSGKTAARLGAEQTEERGLDVRRLSLKEKAARYQSLGSEWAKEQNLPIDVRADQLAEYLVLLRYRIFPTLFPKLANVPACSSKRLVLPTRSLSNEPNGSAEAHPPAGFTSRLVTFRHIPNSSRQDW